MYRSSLVAAAGFLGTVCFLGSSAQGQSPFQAEIAGIRLGMTEAEVRAALKAFDPGLKITPVRGVFNYSDGVNPILKTPEFLDRLEGSTGNQGASIEVYFSGPVGEVRVIGVSRRAMVSNPPTRAQFNQSLMTKYGRPAGFSNGSQNQPVWESDEKSSCVRVRDHKGQTGINLGAGNLGKMLMTNANTEQFLTSRRANAAKGLMPAEPTQCGAFLSYFYTTDPVSSFDANLYDLGAMVATERSRKTWVKQLQEEAVKKRQGLGKTPSL
jgi:hypothetical protein